MLTPKNTRGRPVTKLCLALETFRRTDEGRARDATAFLGHFFPQDEHGSRDRLFVHMPKEVRADLLSNWGIRGKKSALRDDDEKVRMTVVDALAAGDIDASIIEEGVTPEILVDWIPLEDWWAFWRGTTLPLGCVRKALALGRELALFDDRWFLEHLKLTTQKLDKTDVICAALSKDQIVAWLNVVHANGDASPGGLVRALGWETILARTAQEALTFALDSLSRHIGLAPRDLATAKLDGSQATASSSAVGSSAIASPTAQALSGAAKNELTKQPARSPFEPPPMTANAKPAPKAIAEKGAPAAATSALAHGAPALAASAQPTAKPAAPTTPTWTGPGASSALAPTANGPTAQPALSHGTPLATTVHVAPAPAPATSAAALQPASAPLSAAAPIPASTPAQHLPSIIIELEPPTGSSLAESAPPPPPAPTSAPPTARALFGAPSYEPPAMRPPAATLSGVGAPPPVLHGTVDVALPPSSASPDDPAWAPPRAEPGDMGWDIVYGVKRSMSTNVQPRYNFDDDDEPTSEISLAHETRQG